MHTSRRAHATQARRTSPNPRSSRHRRGPRGRTILALVVIALLAGLVVGAVLLWQRVAAFNESVSTEEPLSGRLSDLLGGNERVNVLLLGFADPAHPGAFLSDSINVLSVDPATDKTTAISIPRDLWIEGIPALPGNGK